MGERANMSDPHSLNPIPLAAAEILGGAATASYAVYLPGADGKTPVLYRDVGDALDEPDFKRLAESGLSHIFVSGEALGQCERALENNLSEILQDPRIEPAQKAACVQHVGMTLARDLETETDPTQHLERTSNMLDTVIEGVLADPTVAANLLQMCGHHRNTASHMFAVSTLAILVGTEVFGADSQSLKELGLAGMLHDLGKMRIDPAILNKVTPLTAQEIQIIRQHPIESVRLIGNDPAVTPRVRQIILQHHERIDGCGYPIGLPGSDLLTGSKIMTIVDSFHAIIGRRGYKAEKKPSQAVETLRNAVGTQFDKDLFECWQRVFERCWRVRPAQQATNAPTTEGPGGSFHSDHRYVSSRDISRRLARLLCKGQAKVRCIYAGRLPSGHDGNNEFECTLHDISRSGLCMNTEHPTYRGEIMHILVQSQEQKVWVRGVVRWCRRDGSAGKFKTGIMFTQRISDDDARTKIPVCRIDDTTLFDTAGSNV